MLLPALLLSGCGSFVASNDDQPIITKVPSKFSATITSLIQSGGTSLYQSKDLGIQLEYPAKIFTIKEFPHGVTLQSPYYVVSNFKGTPDGEVKHFLAIAIEVRNKKMVLAMEQDNPFFRETYEKSRSGKLATDFMENFSAAATSGVSFLLGTEGTNTRYSYVPRGPQETVVIKLSYITDFLKDNLKPNYYAETEQLKVFNQVIKSLIFIK